VTYTLWRYTIPTSACLILNEFKQIGIIRLIGCLILNVPSNNRDVIKWCHALLLSDWLSWNCGEGKSGKSPLCHVVSQIPLQRHNGLVANLLRTCWQHVKIVCRVANKSVTSWQLPCLRGSYGETGVMDFRHYHMSFQVAQGVIIMAILSAFTAYIKLLIVELCWLNVGKFFLFISNRALPPALHG